MFTQLLPRQMAKAAMERESQERIASAESGASPTELTNEVVQQIGQLCRTFSKVLSSTCSLAMLPSHIHLSRRRTLAACLFCRLDKSGLSLLVAKKSSGHGN